MAVTFNFNTAACIAKIASSGKMSEKDAKQLLQDVADRGEKMRQTGVPDPFVSAAGKLAEKSLRDAQNGAIDAVKNAGIRAQGQAKIKSQGPDLWATNTKAILHNENGANKENVANFSGQLVMNWRGVMMSELKKAGMLSYAKSEKAFSDIAEAMWDIRQGLGSMTPTAALNSPARAAAYPLMRAAYAVWSRLNGEGARIAEATDYVGHTSHNLELMRYGGRGQPDTPDINDAFAQWYRVSKPLWNTDKVFEDVTPRTGETQAQAEERFAKAAYVAMYTGNHGSHAEPGALKWEGTSNLARKISEGRVFFFKDGKSWAQYMKIYGKQLNALELAVDTIHSGAMAAGNLHFLGTNPEANMRRMIQAVKDEHKDIQYADAIRKYDEELQQDVTKLRPGLEELMYQVGAIPASPQRALEHRILSQRNLNAALQISNMATLGFVGETHLTSLTTTFKLAGYGIDINTFKALGGLVHAMIPHSNDRIATLHEMGALADGLNVHNPYDNGVTIPGAISSAHSVFMTMIGLRYIMRHAKAGFVWMLSNHLVNQSTKTFTELPTMLQRTMQSFGIDSNKWDLIRTMAKIEGSSGHYYIAPNSAFRIDDARVQALLGPQASPADIWQYKQDIADQLGMFYSRMADLSTVTPGPREAALLRGKERGPTLASLFTQFSAWPLAAQHQLIAKTYYESATKGRAFSALFVAAGLSMMSGYIRTTIRNVAAGRSPEEPQNAWDAAFLGLRSMAAGGITGILGDHLIGQIGQQVRNGGSTVLGGPIVSDLFALGQIGAKYAHTLATGGNYNPWSDLAHLGAQNVPFANLIYTKAAFEYGIFFHLFEAAQPGWWERTNQAKIRRGERAYAGYFPGAPIPRTPYGIGD